MADRPNKNLSKLYDHPTSPGQDKQFGVQPKREGIESPEAKADEVFDHLRRYRAQADMHYEASLNYVSEGAEHGD